MRPLAIAWPLAAAATAPPLALNPALAAELPR
jgi:hypothetical protein